MILISIRTGISKTLVQHSIDTIPGALLENVRYRESIPLPLSGLYVNQS